MTTPDYTHLRELAHLLSVEFLVAIDQPWPTADQLSMVFGAPAGDKMREYLAGIDAKTISALLDRLDALEKVREAAEQFRDYCDDTKFLPCGQSLFDDLSQSLAHVRSAK